MGSVDCSQMSTETLNMLVVSQNGSSSSMVPSSGLADPLKDLFSRIDANGDGKLTRSEFESALGAGGTNLAQADDVFSKFDKNGDGLVSFGEMSSALRGAKSHRQPHHHSIADINKPSNSDPLSRMLQGASSTSVTNADGSITTSVTYADGSKVAMTTPASGSSSNAAASSYNFIEQMIQMEAHAISSHSTGSVRA
jgi:Ca2+-binding EF-hand superfamily protein